MTTPRAATYAEAPRRTDRLFFALVPLPEAVKHIGQVRLRLCAEHGLKGRQVAPERLHLTLCFLGDHAGLPGPLLASACHAASQVRLPNFGVVLDRVMSFPRPRGDRPLVLCGEAGMTGVLALQQALAEALRSHGIDLPGAHPYTPHLTLLYDRSELPAAPVPAVSWTARDFVLVRSLIGRGSHDVLQRWPLDCDGQEQPR